MKLFKQSQKAIAALLILSALVGSLTGCGNSGPEDESTGEASLPATADLPLTASSAETDTPAPHQTVPDIESPDDFYAYMIPALLGNSKSENRVCSPANIYMALAMLTEVTAGESQSQFCRFWARRRQSRFAAV